MKPQNSPEYHIRFAFTPGERRAIIILAVIFILGLISLQYRRWRTVDNSNITIVGAEALDITMEHHKEVTIVGAETLNTALVHGVKPSPQRVAKIELPAEEKKESQTEYSEPQQIQYQETDRRSEILSIDLNRANATELEKLPGIGPVLAQRIVEFRNNNGKFKRAEDLLLVRGIGQKRLADLLPYIVIKP